MQRRRVLMAAGKKSRLPSGYREVAWIGQPSTLSAYINTNYIIQSGFSQFICHSVTFLTNNSCHIMGVRKAISGTANLVFGSNNANSSGIQALFIGSTWSATREKVGLNMQKKFTCEYENGLQRLLVDDVQKIRTTYTNLNFNDFIEHPLFLFAANLGYRANNVGTEDFATINSGQIDILHDGDTARSLVPCVRENDDKPGMYDLAESICPLTNTPFYINAGSGEFTIGPNV